MSASEPAPSACLYWTAVSHPSQAVRKMLELKGVDYRLVNVLPLNQRLHLRLAGFRAGTVPALFPRRGHALVQRHALLIGRRRVELRLEDVEVLLGLLGLLVERTTYEKSSAIGSVGPGNRLSFNFSGPRAKWSVSAYA